MNAARRRSRAKVGEEGQHVLAKEAAKLANSAAELLLRVDGSWTRSRRTPSGWPF